MPARSARLALGVAWILKLVARVVWISAMVLVPLFGFWLASSLAAYQNASQRLALLGGLALFPLLPVGWELIFAWRRSQRPPERAILTGLDRLVLRTLIVNGVFLAGMMWFQSATAIRALAVRGDWMLEGHDGPIATEVRGFLLGLADRLDKRRNAGESYGTSDAVPEDAKPAPEDAKPAHEDAKPAPEDAKPAPEEPAAKPPAGSPGEWPLPHTPDPSVTSIPEAEQASVEAVGRYFAARIDDPRRRVKALHDYVVLRLTYDQRALELIQSKDFARVPSQEAEAVFAARTGVCEGYARLMVALGKAAGVEIAYITGYIRDAQRRAEPADSEATMKSALEGYSHAWNAVKLDGRWWLLDATWDDPTGDRPAPESGTAEVDSTFLFTPPRLFALNHLPEEEAWQLLEEPLSTGDFVRQPMLSPRIGALGLALREPNRSQVTVHGDVAIVLDNPRGALVSAVARLDGGKRGEEARCTVTPAPEAIAAGAARSTRTTIACNLDEGEYEVRMFAAPARGSLRGPYTLDYVGSILVNSR
jgi:transglutaminase-like putative cysteine protease